MTSDVGMFSLALFTFLLSSWLGPVGWVRFWFWSLGFQCFGFISERVLSDGISPSFNWNWKKKEGEDEEQEEEEGGGGGGEGGEEKLGNQVWKKNSIDSNKTQNHILRPFLF